MARNPQSSERKRNTEVERLLSVSGRTQDQVADYLTRRLGRDFRGYHLSRIVTGERTVKADEMDALRELSAQPADATPPVVDLLGTGDSVPLFGYANAAGQTLRINEDARVGVVPIHPAQAGSRSAFAFIGFGDSVSPRLNHGEVGYAIRNRSPFRGQLAVIEKTDGEALIKFFQRMDERTLFLTQLNPPKEISIALKDVAAIHAVVGVSFGPG